MRPFILLVLHLIGCYLNGSVGAQVMPSGGRTDVVWRPGTAVDVSWGDQFSASSVNIELYDAARQRRTVVAKGVDARLRTTGIVLPDSLSPGKHYLVFVRDAANNASYIRSTGYLPVEQSLARIRPTDVPNTDSLPLAFAIAPNPTTASSVLTWDMVGVRRIRVTGSDGVVRLEKDVEPTDRRLAIPSDTWLSGTYVLELIGPMHVLGRSLIVVVH
jgi:hypothetical protein